MWFFLSHHLARCVMLGWDQGNGEKIIRVNRDQDQDQDASRRDAFDLIQRYT